MPTDPSAESPLPEPPKPAGAPPPPAGAPRRRAFLRGALSAGVTGVVAGTAGGYAYRATPPAPAVVPDGLTVTVGVGSTLFDDRDGLAPRLPAKLTPMLPFPNDDLDPAQCGGDLVIQLSAGHADTVMYALRDIARHTRGGMQAAWRIDGFCSPARPSRRI